jgi:hypothetical protein
MIRFQKVRPAQFVKIIGGHTDLIMTEDQFADVYHILQSEPTAFFTALVLVGLQTGSVHTDLNLTATHIDPDSLEGIIMRAQMEKPSS